MNARIVGITLIATAALSVGLAACGGGKSSSAKTNTAATGTPKAGVTASSSASASKTVVTGKTAGATLSANQTPGASTAQTPGAATTDAPGGAPVADVTIGADGTATNSQGTPVTAPTPGTAATPGSIATVGPGPTVAPGATPVAKATAPGTGPRIVVDAPAAASGDFTVTVRLDGVTEAYIGFNIALTFDEGIISATDATAGTTLSTDPNQQFCAASPATVTGAKTLGCTLLNEVASTANGVLATFSFKRNSSGAVQLHVRTTADTDAVEGTYLIVRKNGAISPLDVGLNDATVIVS